MSGLLSPEFPRHSLRMTVAVRLLATPCTLFHQVRPCPTRPSPQSKTTLGGGDDRRFGGSV